MGTMKGTITRRLDNSLNTLQTEFGELICDRDFKRSLQALKQASRSERPYLEDAGFRGRAAIQKYVGRRTNKKVQENDVLTDLDDGVFDVLGGASKAQRRPNGTYGLLKAADDLASGKFRMGGTT